MNAVGTYSEFSFSSCLLFSFPTSISPNALPTFKKMNLLSQIEL